MIRLKEKFFEAKKLREKGYSLKEISEKLDIAKSTLSVWLRDIRLSKTALKRLEKRRLLGRIRSSETKRKRRQERDRLLEIGALKLLKSTKITKNHLKLFCGLLYWCEGAKDIKARGPSFTNSDPEMIRTFLTLFRSSFNIDEKKFRALIHLHSYHSIKKQMRFWSEVTNIPLSQFYKSYQKPNTGKRIRKNYPGCISVRYQDARIYQQFKTLWKIFAKKYGGVG